MSFIKKILEEINENSHMHGDGIHSGERVKNGQGKLTHHFTVDDIDPVSLADKETNDEFQREVDKKAKSEEVTSMMTHSAGNTANHTHEFKVGDQRTSTDEGHDHSIVYKNGKPIMTGPGPEDGHIHTI